MTCFTRWACLTAGRFGAEVDALPDLASGDAEVVPLQTAGLRLVFAARWHVDKQAPAGPRTRSPARELPANQPGRPAMQAHAGRGGLLRAGRVHDRGSTSISAWQRGGHPDAGRRDRQAGARKPISVAVFAGAAAWPPAASTCHGDHLIEPEMQRPEAGPDQVPVRPLGLKRQVNQIGNRPRGTSR